MAALLAGLLAPSDLLAVDGRQQVVPLGFSPAIHGVVLDPAGRPIADARLVVSTASWRVEGRTDARGGFRLVLPEAAEARLAVEAPGFVQAEVGLPVARLAAPLRVTLALPALAEQVTVTASRTEMPVARTPASVAVISRIDLETSPALALDETLRQVPGFALFRRTSSLTANPTSQGVSLRGLGASGASRALVLDDGVPLNDPFGGWVYWDRVPSALIERVEVARGGASDLYGSAAVAGVVTVVRRATRHPFLRADAIGGSMETGRLSLSAGAAPGAWMVSAGGEAQTTGGYVAVAREERGPVDTPVASRYAVVDVSATHRLAGDGSVFVRASLFGESRHNGTPVQDNDTRAAQVAGGARRGWLGGGVTLRGYASRQTFNQAFSAIAADRRSEQAVRRQRVPSHAAGASVQWERSAGRHLWVAGGEGRTVSGTTRERVPGPAGDWGSWSEAGGTQSSTGVFLADTVALSSSVTVTGSVRGDWWRNGDAAQAGGTNGTETRRSLPIRTERSFSPRVGAVYRIAEAVTIVGSAYRAFRAPTLNELYRSFRLGNVSTLANENLRAERVAGVDAGLRVSPSSNVLLSGRVFAMSLENAVANVTLSRTPGLVTRQRQNLGAVSSRGVELESEARLAGVARLRAAYLFNAAVVSSFPADLRLQGLRVPQQPRHVVTVGAAIRNSAFGDIAVDARWSGLQFEDDQNGLPLSSCFTAGAAYSRRVTSALELLAAGENLSDTRCQIGRSPVLLLGPPRALRVGGRLAWGRVLQ